LKSLQQYHIPFTGLKQGKHQFEFEVDDKFFTEFEYSLVKNGKLKVEMEMDKQETMLILNFHIKGDIFLTCDLCLAGFPLNIEIIERQIVKFSNDNNPEDNTEEIIVLSKNEHELDVSTLIYEYVNLALPYINRCDDEGNTKWCDSEMIEKLNSLSSSKEEEENDLADPRWEALKKIKKN
jgi:uncharacterized metal-binding protein YceD (DUF177 family)